MEREQVDKLEVTMPRPSIPMPGDEIFWYRDSIPFKGRLTGYNCYFNPVVENDFLNIDTLESFGQIRLLDPSLQIGPNWKRLPENGALWAALPQEISRFDKILSKQIPPGPKYYTFITEIWNRGFEIYLVGGTVRDVICGLDSHDVDLVTTMPLTLALPLIKSLYRYTPTIDSQRGFIRIGGKPRTGDPFIDLKCFCHSQPGTPAALFGSCFARDLAHRDFACNSVYYDPINKVYVDPSGRGVLDASEKRLYFVCEKNIRNSYHLGTIAIRFFKFMTRGFTCCNETKTKLIEEFIPCLNGLAQKTRIRYTRTQLLSKYDPVDHEDIINRFKEVMLDFGLEDCWSSLFEPISQDILFGRSEA